MSDPAPGPPQPQQPQRRQRAASKAKAAEAKADDPTAAGGGVASLSLGSLIAIVAASLSDGVLKTLLIWLAPASTMAFWAAWSWGAGRLKAMQEWWAIESTFRKAKAAIEAAMEVPLTDEQRAAFAQQLADLHQQYANYYLARASSRINK